MRSKHTAIRWLAVGACALGVWVWLRPEPDNAQVFVRVPPELLRQAAAPTPAAPAPTPVQAASFGASAIEIIVGRNDTLDRIFRRLKLDLSDLASLRGLPGIKTALDRLRPGEALHLLHRDGSLVALERRISPVETLKVVRDEAGFRADVLQNPLETHVRTIRGTIDSSLFEAVNTAGARDPTALGLSEIFAWDIDFVLDVQPGDSFTVTYEEQWQDGHYFRDGPVLAARFINQGREYRAVRYTDPTGATRYYSPDGHSMQKAFLRAPLEFSRVSSGFNSARRHPILNTIRAHKGVDYAAPIGTPVHAAGDGRVRFAGQKGGYGNVIEIAHANGIVTRYGHLSRFAKGMHVGESVAQGTLIAYVGMTGLATGPHLHYEYQVNGVHQNPQTVKLPQATPIDPQWKADFERQTAPKLASLDTPAGPVLLAREPIAQPSG